ncbi:MAG: family efflux pump outer membrane protein [Deltaproteobacteria bacterium]|nr:family efflux pump outer membrane protein [Deltaproteobacteria bacterium]
MQHFIITTFLMLFLVAPVYSMTVEEAVQHALGHNPDLQALRLEEDTAKGLLQKARLLLINNPTIGGNISKKDKPEEEDGGAFTNYGFKLSQEFEVAGQRGSRIAVAENELARVQSGIKDRERILIGEVKDSFTKGLALKKKNELAREIVQLKEELLGYTRIKFQAGDISGLDVNLAEVELSKAKRDLLLSGREYRESLVTLQGFMGVSPDKPLTLQGDLPLEAPVLPERAILYEAAFALRPDAKSAVFEVEKTKAALKLARKEVIPNVTLSGFYDRDELRNTVGLEISMPFPLFDRKQAERKEAYVKAEGAKIKSEGLKKTIEREVEQAYSDLAIAIEELTLFKKEIIVKTAENLNLLNLAFKEGKVGFFEVRLAQKDTIEARFAYIEAQTRTRLAQNAIEKITGGTLK